MLSNEEREVLDNFAWHALTTTHARFAVGAGAARRYPPELTVFAALECDAPVAWSALAAVVDPDETVVITGGSPVEVPAGWTRLGGGFGDQMMLPALGPAVDLNGAGIVPLHTDHVEQMLALIAIAQPGPFRARTIELGDYYGVFDEDGQLIAMAGERFSTPRFVEVSAVSTHPDARGRGLASALTHRVAAGIIGRGQIPVLHVAHGNDSAKRIYERLGFVLRRAVSFTAVQRDAAD